MTIGERIKHRREDLGISVEEVARRLGKHRATIYRYESNEIMSLPTDVLEPLAAVLETTPAVLMGWEEPLPANLVPLRPMDKVALIGQIACGEPILAEENIVDYVDVPGHIHADYALICKGDSMINAGIQDGDLVYIRQQEEVENGQIAAILIEDEATLKRFYRKGNTVQLLPENPAFAPLVFFGEEASTIRILGLAVAYTHVI